MNLTYGGGRVLACWFSATGTTKAVVQQSAAALAETLGAPLESFDFTLPQARTAPPELRPGDVAVVGLPVYAGRLPNVLLPYLNTWEGGGAAAIPVVVYGNRNFDDALMELRELLESHHFHTFAAAAFVGEHAFSTTLAAGRPDETDLQEAADFGRQAGLALLRGAASPVDVPGNCPVGPYYQPRDRAGNPIDIRKVKSKVNADCDRCGVCAALCPMGSIDPVDVSRYTGICIKCGACIKGCPKHARYYDDPGYLYHKEELELGYPGRAPIWRSL